MAVLLHIEASTECCSVALSEDGEVFFEKRNSEERSHAKVLAPFVEEAIDHADSRGKRIEAVSLSSGPGSYTSLRIASSTAKGVCYGRNIPLIALPTTAIMCVPVLFRDDLPEEALLCPMIDARRMEVYTAFFNEKLERISETEALVIDENSFMEMKQDNHLYLFGDGADKLASLFENDERITVVEKFHCSASYMAELADKAFKNNDFVDTAYFEPFYLKNFVPGLPKVKGLN